MTCGKASRFCIRARTDSSHLEYLCGQVTTLKYIIKHSKEKQPSDCGICQSIFQKVAKPKVVILTFLDVAVAAATRCLKR